MVQLPKSRILKRSSTKDQLFYQPNTKDMVTTIFCMSVCKGEGKIELKGHFPTQTVATDQKGEQIEFKIYILLTFG